MQLGKIEGLNKIQKIMVDVVLVVEDVVVDDVVVDKMVAVVDVVVAGKL